MDFEDRSVMVVGHQHRYKNRIVTCPGELDSISDWSRVPKTERLTNGTDLSWFLIELGGPLTEGDSDKVKIPGFGHSDNTIDKLRDSDAVYEVLRINNNSRSGGCVRDHEGTKVINIPYRLTPEYSVSEGNDAFTKEQKQNLDAYRELDDEALFGPNEDIIFIRDLRITESAYALGEVYLLFDWDALCRISSEYLKLAFGDTLDREYVIDAETMGDLPSQNYLEVLPRVLDLVE